MSSATDPYQPIETKLGLTRSVLEVLAERQPRLVIQTRGPLVERDFDLLLRFKKVRLNMSITTDSDEVRKQFEPGCASIERRLATVAAARRLGITTTVCVMPMLPVENPSRFAEMIRATNTNYVTAGSFRHSDRPFAASTRQPALDLARECGWTKESVERARRIMWLCLPDVDHSGRGWMPE